MTYIPDPVTQRDGSSLANSNCLMAAAAVGLDYETLGAKTSTGAKMRNYSGDTSGGTNSDEIERAWHNGYNENPTTRDGQPFTKVVDDLEAGRAVMLQVWHATTGKVCVSGSGAYGHGMTVLPKQRMNDGQREWYVADPWCNPPKWGWVRESKLKAGAEEWVKHSASGAVGTYGDRWPDPNTVPLRMLKAAATILMNMYDPAHPSPFPFAGGVAGPKAPGVLFVSTRAHQESDVAINGSGKGISTTGRVRLTADAGFYKEPEFVHKYGTLSDGRECILLGPALGTNAFAILVNTSAPYDDGQDRDTVVYVTKDKCGDPYSSEPEPEPNPDQDKLWREWLDTDPHAPDKV